MKIYIVLIIVFFSCKNENERIISASFATYRHYLLNDTTDLRSIDTLKYSIDLLNDSTILLKLYSLGKYEFISLAHNKLDSKERVDTLNYRRIYLNLKTSNKPESQNIRDVDFWEDEFYVLDSEREYNIDNKTIKILSFSNDHDYLADGDYRIFYSNEIGYIAGYSHSDFDASICKCINEKRKEKYRNTIIDKLVADTTFFPFPKELYPRHQLIRN
ncbi:MAG: hypothetical protein AAGU19_23260 [Prolixibacteraceae bacterium]